MNGSRSHMIRQQFLHIDYEGSESEGLALQRELTDLCNERMLPAIEEALDRCAPADGTLCLDRLEIDVGTLAIDRLEKELSETIARGIEKTLRDRFPASTGDSRKEFLVSHPGLPSSITPRLQWKDSRQHVLEAFLHFLDKGRFPWSFRLLAGETLEQAVRNHLPDLLISDIRTILMSPGARLRLVQQFSREFLADVVARAAPELPRVVQRVQEMVLAAEPGPERSAFTDRLWEAALVQISTGKTASNSSQLARMVLYDRKVLPPDVEAKLKELVRADGADSPADARDTPRDEKNERKEHRATLPGDAVDDATGQQSPRERSMSESSSDEEAIYVDNAGLVLLHPFLSLFFEAVGVVREGTLRQPDRALSLLHFLGTGQEIAPEHELVLPKLLCGLDPDTPMSGCGLLSENEKSEATALLGAVIRHWEALRSTTPEGLRGSFLLRPGKLSLRKDREWILQVESRSFDLLLDSLPWGFSMIQLPWMGRMLRVEWGESRL